MSRRSGSLVQLPCLCAPPSEGPVIDHETSTSRRDGTLDTEREGADAFLGTDVEHGRWLAGIALSMSTADAGFHDPTDDIREEGEAEAKLTAVWPYARVNLGERIALWGMGGLGQGELTLDIPGPAGTGTRRYETDMDLTVAGIGSRTTLLAPKYGDALSVAFKSDVLWTKTETGRVQGMMASEGSTSRTRLGIEASRTFETGRGTFTPSGSVGIRHDGGDAETGTGIEIGMGLAFRAGRLSTEAQVDMLASHADDHYEAWSAFARPPVRAAGRGPGLEHHPSSGLGSSGQRIARLGREPPRRGRTRGRRTA